jgi:L-ribulose-5-phosphate 3-epimerase
MLTMQEMDRRSFLERAAAVLGGLGLLPSSSSLLRAGSPAGGAGGSPEPPPVFKISLAEWSLNKNLFSKKLDNLDFPRYAKKEFGIDTVEYVDQFFKDKSRDTIYLTELKKRCDGEGVRSGLIMVDTAGELAGPDAEKRKKAVESHQAWIDAAHFLGCHTVRVNAWGKGTPAELHSRMVESAVPLAEHGAKLGLNVVIENHGGTSSDADWLVGVIREVNSPWFGILPDFGNFPPGADRYAAVEKWMPYAKAVSAKSGRFDARGNEVDIDYPRMMKIVLDAGYRGYLGIETEVESAEEEPQGIRFTKALLEEARARMPAMKPLWNGRDLSGWVQVAGGEWKVEEGLLVGRNGKDWSTDPSRTGSWLRTEKEYADFELALEYTVGPRSNSGVFIRAGLERNPAFTGYEVQILDAPGAPPSKGGPGSLYDYVAPTKNLVRPAGQWNSIRVIARGPSIRVHVNDQLVVDARGDRLPKGYLGLQNHDARSEVKFRNIFLAELHGAES